MTWKPFISDGVHRAVFHLRWGISTFQENAFFIKNPQNELFNCSVSTDNKHASPYSAHSHTEIIFHLVELALHTDPFTQIHWDGIKYTWPMTALLRQIFHSTTFSWQPHTTPSRLTLVLEYHEDIFASLVFQIKSLASDRIRIRISFIGQVCVAYTYKELDSQCSQCTDMQFQGQFSGR